MEDPIKNAFSRVKQDIFNLENEMYSIKQEISEIKMMLLSLHETLNTRILHEISENNTILYLTDTPTHQHINPTHPNTSTHPQEIGGLKSPNLGISTRNEGVPTDRQTHQQTDQHINFPSFYSQETPQTIESDIKKASEIISSLDHLKKEIRYKFKQLTPQEMTVFSTIYQLEEKDPQHNTYNKIAEIIHLSESSVRDYVNKIIKKGIPVKKQKINNKQILLSISNELKKIATLSTIMQLRGL